MVKISKLAPKRFPNMLAVAGVRLSAGDAGLGYKGRDDVMVATLAPGTSAAGLFTRSSMVSAPVVWCRRLVQASKDGAAARVLVVNSANANAFTGATGHEDVLDTARAAAALAGCDASEVYVASTGVIGVPLPTEKLTGVLPGLFEALATGSWKAAATAIHTTDTFAKGACRVARIDGHEVVISGIAKGSGMIRPDMATMLAFIFTNAAIPSPVLHQLVAEANAVSFNSITVDSDTSTSDTVLVFATAEGARHGAVTDAGDPRLDDFRRRLMEVMVELATMIVRDGEGASKFITVNVTGAADDGAARAVAFAIANSPLLKTAIAGEDANWGRIVMAVGKSGAETDQDRLVISIGGQQITADGAVSPDYDEDEAARHLKGDEIDIAVELGMGAGTARVWTCDFTHDYVTINADYRS